MTKRQIHFQTDKLKHKRLKTGGYCTLYCHTQTDKRKKDSQTDRYTVRQTDRYTVRQTSRWIEDSQTDRNTVRQTGRWIEDSKKTDILSNKQANE